MIPDLTGKGNRRRTVPVPAAVKIRVEEWILAAELDLDKRGGKPGGRLFRPISKAGKLTGPYMKDEKGIWQMVVAYARQTSLGKLSPHDLRRTCAKLCRKAGGDLEQIQLLLGHASIQTRWPLGLQLTEPRATSAACYADGLAQSRPKSGVSS